MKYSLLLTIVLFLAVVVLSNEVDDLRGIGERFHWETSFGNAGAKGQPVWGASVPLYKEYPDARRVSLNTSLVSDMPLAQAIAERKSTRQFSDKSVTIPELTKILLSANGLTNQTHGYAHRTTPSAGALYPIDLYVAVHSVEGLDSGLYHFQVIDTTLALIESGDLGEQMQEAANDQSAVGNSPVTVVIAAHFDRVTKKYADRGYRYAYMEAGAVMQNVYLQATALGLGTVSVGAFNDDLLNELLGINGVHEAGLVIMPIGWPR